MITIGPALALSADETAVVNAVLPSPAAANNGQSVNDVSSPRRSSPRWRGSIKPGSATDGPRRDAASRLRQGRLRAPAQRHCRGCAGSNQPRQGRGRDQGYPAPRSRASPRISRSAASSTSSMLWAAERSRPAIQPKPRPRQATGGRMWGASVPLLTEDSQSGADLRVCANEENRANIDQRS